MCPVTYLCLQYWTLDYGQLFWVCILTIHIQSAYFSIFSYSSIRSFNSFSFLFLCRHMTLLMESETYSDGSEQSLVPTAFIVAWHGSFGNTPASIKNKANHPYHHHYHQSSRITLFFFWQASRIYWWARVRNGQNQGSQECRAHQLPRRPWLGMYLTPQPSKMSCFSVTRFPNSSH